MIALLDEAEHAVAVEEELVTTEQQQQQQQQQQEHQHQMPQQVAAEFTHSPSLAPYGWITTTPVQLVGVLAPMCDVRGQQVQQLQLMQACPIPTEQPAVVEHAQVPLQAWAFPQQLQEEQQQWREQQQPHMQLQLLPQLHISKEHAGGSQRGFRDRKSTRLNSSH